MTRRMLALGGALVVALGVTACFVLGARPSLPAALVTPARQPPAVSAAALREQARVILVTIDGARWQDVLDTEGALGAAGERPALPKTLAAVRAGGVALLGETASAKPISLPGYLALSSGRASACTSNDCPRITDETLFEEVARRLRTPLEGVAVFATWSRLPRAATSRDGAVLVDAPPDGQGHPGGPPWPNARWDAETIERAVTHFRAHRPRLLYLALVDSDERAHRKEPAQVVRALGQADEAMARLLAEVALLPEGERGLVTLLITTDHGRGPGPLWADHGAYASSRDIFLLALGGLVRGGGGSFTQADVRPTVLRLLGLCPEPCAQGGCGAPIEAVAGTQPCER